jgi:hypothetical protein
MLGLSERLVPPAVIFAKCFVSARFIASVIAIGVDGKTWHPDVHGHGRRDRGDTDCGRHYAGREEDGTHVDASFESYDSNGARGGKFRAVAPRPPV